MDRIDGIGAGIITVILLALVVGLSASIGWAEGHQAGKREGLTTAQLKIEAIEAVLAQ